MELTASPTGTSSRNLSTLYMAMAKITAHRLTAPSVEKQDYIEGTKDTNGYVKGAKPLIS